MQLFVRIKIYRWVSAEWYQSLTAHQHQNGHTVPKWLQRQFYSLRTALCESICYQAKSEQNVRQDLIPRVRHGEAALCWTRAITLKSQPSLKHGGLSNRIEYNGIELYFASVGYDNNKNSILYYYPTKWLMSKDHEDYCIWSWRWVNKMNNYVSRTIQMDMKSKDAMKAHDILKPLLHKIHLNITLSHFIFHTF